MRSCSYQTQQQLASEVGIAEWQAGGQACSGCTSEQPAAFGCIWTAPVMGSPGNAWASAANLLTCAWWGCEATAVGHVGGVGRQQLLQCQRGARWQVHNLLQHTTTTQPSHSQNLYPVAVLCCYYNSSVPQSATTQPSAQCCHAGERTQAPRI